MGLSGSLRTLSLDEIFQTLARSRATGLLRLSSAEGGCDVVFADGDIIDLLQRQQDLDFTLLQRLEAMGLIEARPQVAPGVSGGFATVQALINDGHLEQGQVDEARQQFLFDELCDLFTWLSANFLFREATPQDREASAAVRTAQALPVRIQVGTLLMESARRVDEWNVARAALPPDDAVMIPMEGREDELASSAQGYPAAPIVALIDGVHCIDDIIRCVPVARTEVHLVLYELIQQGLLRVLDVDEMELLGQQAIADERYTDAIALLRRVLALDADRLDSAAALAQALEARGDAPQASGAFRQLALTHLRDGDRDQAVAHARRSVELGGGTEAHLILVRCLVEAGDRVKAAVELLGMARHLVTVNRLDDARSTVLKVLQLDANNQEARRELSRIYAQSGDAEGDSQQVVCVACGESNPREAEHCTSCGAELHLSCMSCGRVVAVSDRICVFCGANPHIDASGRGRGVTRGPSTDVFMRSGSISAELRALGTERWQNEVKGKVDAARRLEEAERFSESLEVWKELAREQVDNAQLLAHIRELEAIVHDQGIERQIERGHRCRHSRRYLSALACYRAARRALAVDDPRAERLEDLIESTRQGARKTSLVYAIALLLLAAFGVLVAMPYVERARYERRIDEALERIRAAADDPGRPTVVFAGIGRLPEQLQPDPSYGAQLTARHEELLNVWRTVRFELARRTLIAVREDLDEGRWEQAEAVIESYLEQFGSEVLGGELRTLTQRVEEISQQARAADLDAEQAPERLRRAREDMAAGRLARALAALEPLESVGNAALAAEAAGLAEQLREQRQRYSSAVAEARSLQDEDLERAELLLRQQAGAAESWNQAERHAELAARVMRALEEARESSRQLGAAPDLEAIEAYLAAHPGGPNAAALRRRAQQLVADQQRRQTELQDGLVAWRAARERGDLAVAWEQGRSLFQRYRDQAREAGVLLPLRLDLGQPEARLLIDGAEVAVADADGVLLWWHVLPQRGAAEIQAPGFEAMSLSWSELDTSWQHRLPLQRSLRWSWQGQGAVLSLAAIDGGWLAINGPGLTRLRRDGSVGWRQRVGLDGPYAAGRPPVWTQHVELPGGVLAVPQGEGGLLLFDRSGGSMGRLGGPRSLLDRPALYVSDLLGGDRMAIVDGALHLGPVSGPLSELSAGERLISGPISFVADVDRVLAVGGISGRLIGIAEGSGRPVWQLDLRAADIGPLQQLDERSLVTVLDGSRLACIEILGTQGARLRWEEELGGSLAGQPLVAGQAVWLARGDEVVRLDANGVRRRVATLPAMATATPALAGDLLLVGCGGHEGHQVIAFRDGAEVWRRRTPAAVTALAGDGKGCVVGTAEGAVLALEP